MKKFLIGLVGATLFLLPLCVYPLFLTKLYSFGLFSLAFYLLYSTTGLLSFGHAAFFAIGAYSAGIFAKLGLTLELSLVLAGFSGALFAVLMGALAIRRNGIYFSMITLAFAQLVFYLALKFPITGGEDGLQAIPRVPLLGLIPSTSDFFYANFVLFLLLATLWILHRLFRSPFGLLLRAMRSHEARTESLAYNVYATKLALFVTSGVLATLAGALKSLGVGIASLSDAHWHLSGEVVLAVLLGGMGSLAGPLLGSFVIMTLQEYLAPFGAWLQFFQGLLYVFVLMFLREGLSSLLRRSAGRL